jgi:hypothetical protein
MKYGKVRGNFFLDPARLVRQNDKAHVESMPSIMMSKHDKRAPRAQWASLAALIAAVATVNNGWAFAGLIAVLAWTLYVTS